MVTLRLQPLNRVAQDPGCQGISIPTADEKIAKICAKSERPEQSLESLKLRYSRSRSRSGNDGAGAAAAGAFFGAGGAQTARCRILKSLRWQATEQYLTFLHREHVIITRFPSFGSSE